MLDDSQKKAGAVLERNRASRRWMGANYYPEWAQVLKSYRCERSPEVDEDGKEDNTQTSIGMPDTWAYVNRTGARLTAQLPNLNYRSKEQVDSDLIGHTLMYQWDRGGVQRSQKKHVRQALIFGWSVRAWYWYSDERVRKKRVDPYDGNPETQKLIADSYEGVNPADPEAIAQLLATKGRGGLLPVGYMYKAYEGPMADFLFVGDVFPEPNYQDAQKSEWFQVRRRRNKDWLKKLAQFDEMKEGIDRLLKDQPHGSPDKYGTGPYGNSQQVDDFYTYMPDVYGHGEDFISMDNYGVPAKTWTIYEEHIPGDKPRLRLVTEDGIWIGEMEYPYELEGRIAFTELVLIDDLLFGIGDSTVRAGRGVQQVHDRLNNVRWDLIDAIARPYMGTMDRDLYENPDTIKRLKGLRLIYLRHGPQSIWEPSQQAAIASAMASMQDESTVARMWQLLTGESNMSMAANVDPQQGRTATGARILAYNSDVLTKDLLDMLAQSNKADAEMMYLLNRSELTEPVTFDSNVYRRFASKEDLLRQAWTTAEPQLFQHDGEIVAEVGSTLADDDEARAQRAFQLWSVAASRPDLYNQQTARDRYLRAMGEGRNLAEWAVPPMPPAEPPPPPVKPTMSISVKWEMLDPITQAAILKDAGIELQPTPPAPPEGGIPGAPPPGPPVNGVPMMPPGPPPPGPPEGGMVIPEEQLAGAGAYAASRGRNPLPGAM